MFSGVRYRYRTLWNATFPIYRKKQRRHILLGGTPDKSSDSESFDFAESLALIREANVDACHGGVIIDRRLNVRSPSPRSGWDFGKRI